MLDELYNLYPQLNDDWMCDVGMKFTSVDRAKFYAASKCFACNVVFTTSERKCRHHDQVTGEYLGACHNVCNMRMRLNKLQIPVLFRNGKGYDFHAIIRSLSAERAKRSIRRNTR